MTNDQLNAIIAQMAPQDIIDLRSLVSIGIPVSHQMSSTCFNLGLAYWQSFLPVPTMLGAQVIQFNDAPKMVT